MYISNLVICFLSIQHILGTLNLGPPNADEEIDLVDWIHASTLNTSGAETEAARLRTQCALKDAQITRLTTQLRDLADAKEAHETALLSKFCDVLNEKKLKIRDQQRLLAATIVNPNAGKYTLIQSTTARSAEYCYCILRAVESFFFSVLFT